MDLVERNIGPDDLPLFRETRLKDYRLLLVREALIGENVCVETLDAITRREIEAGRMTPDDELRVVAVAGMATEHSSRAEAIAAQKPAAIAPPPQAPAFGWRRLLSRLTGH